MNPVNMPPLPDEPSHGGPSHGGPLSAAQYQELAIANGRAAKIRKAARVAAFNGWTLAILAALSFPFCWSSLPGIFITVGMAVIAFNELRGRKGLLRFQPPMATMLGWNQVALMLIAVIYFGWSLALELRGDSNFATELARQVKANRDVAVAFDEIGGVENLYRLLAKVLYGSLIVASLIVQGLNAFYYFTRRKLMDAYVRDTPGWVIDVQRTLATG